MKIRTNVVLGYWMKDDFKVRYRVGRKGNANMIRTSKYHAVESNLKIQDDDQAIKTATFEVE